MQKSSHYIVLQSFRHTTDFAKHQGLYPKFHWHCFVNLWDYLNENISSQILPHVQSVNATASHKQQQKSGKKR